MSCDVLMIPRLKMVAPDSNSECGSEARRLRSSPLCHIASMLCKWDIWHLERWTSFVKFSSSHAELEWKPSVFDQETLAISLLLYHCFSNINGLAIFCTTFFCWIMWIIGVHILLNALTSLISKNPILLMNCTLVDIGGLCIKVCI